MSTAAIPVHVALVDDSHTIGHGELARLAGALSEQVAADFAPAWKVAATVGAYPEAPEHTWAIHLQDGIDEQGAAGYHADEHRQPYARVDLTAGDWTVTVSHELLEMLADPFGSRLHTAKAPVGWRGASPRVRYLLEVCDPCEATSYPVGGVRVSDFLLPAYYRSSGRRHDARSHAGGVAEPLEVADGGYISFVDPATGIWWQRFVQGGRTSDRELGQFDQSFASLREWTDHQARANRAG